MSNLCEKLNIVKNQFEHAAWRKNAVIAGVDEVGRGCLAGPVITAAVILPINTSFEIFEPSGAIISPVLPTSPLSLRQTKPSKSLKSSKSDPLFLKSPESPPILLKDSKLLSPKERERAYMWITQNCHWAIGIAHHRDIDQHNIWQATLIAMQRSLMGLLSSCPVRPNAIVIDAMPVSLAGTAYTDIPIYHFIHGEERSSSIAAASIIAKVTRDRLMSNFCHLFPGYQLGQHKGYGTKAHQEALALYGRSLIHRTSFACKALAIEPILQVKPAQLIEIIQTPQAAQQLVPGQLSLVSSAGE